ncbi:MAG: hypothetical protein HOV80_33860 [Polyangiaceae bacterium]|nr:hypothetical protein [Polyangiaceae bacterium]
MQRLLFLAPLLLVLSGCAAASPAETPEVLEVGDSMLARCERNDQDVDVRAFYCGGLTAVETVVLSASDRDVVIAFEQFAASFSGASPKRIDSVYTAGEARHTWMRLEGTQDGRPLEAQMVAVAQGGGVRLVTCSTRDETAPCGPIVSSLVHRRY